MSHWEVRLALASDAAEILKLQAIPMMGSIHISMTSPIKIEDRVALVFRDHQLMGMGVRTRSQHRWNHDLHWTGVLTSMRSVSAFLPRHTFLEVYRLIRSHPASDEPPWDLTSILEDNKAARRLVEAGLRGMPKYSPVANVITYTFKTLYTSKISAPALKKIESVKSSKYSFRLERVLGRSTIIYGYSTRLKFIRPFLNPFLKIRGLPQLPNPGSELNEAYVVDANWVSGDRNSLKSIVAEIQSMASSVRAELIHWGIPSDHPDSAWLKSQLKAWETRSVIYAVHDANINPPQLKNFWPEVSRL